MNEHQVIYKHQKRTTLSIVLWVLAILAIATVVCLYLYGRTIHDSLA